MRAAARRRSPGPALHHPQPVHRDTRDLPEPRPRGPALTPLPDLDAYLDRWAALHGGYDPRASRFVGPWLRLTYVVARPLARAGIAPDVVSLLGVLAGVVVVGLAEAGGLWLLLGAWLVVGSGLLDNLDGAVAVLTDRVSAWGYVLDSVVDRLTDTLYVVALWRAGAPPEVAALGGGLALLQEYARARAGAAGMREIGVVTVSERPTRVIVTAMFLAAAGVQGAGIWAALGAWAWVGLGLVACLQLTVAVRRALRGQPPPPA